MKAGTSTPMTERRASPNAFEPGKPGTNARSDVEGAIERLRQHGGIFVEAVRATRMAMALTDPSLPGNPIVFANQSFLDLSGYSMEEVLGQQPYFMNGPETDPEDAERFRRILEADEDGVVETVQYGKDGRRFVATVLLTAFKDEAGKTLHHFLSWADVTRRVDAEEEADELRETQAALRESEAKYRALFDSIDEGYCVGEVLFDTGGKPVDYVFLETNAAFERQTGLPDVVGKRMRQLAPQHERHWFDTYGRIALTGEPQRFEQPAEALGRWYDVYAFRSGKPEQRQVAVLFNDIGERKHTEAALREKEERQAFLLALGDAMREQSSAEGKIEVAAHHVGEQLAASRVLYAEYDWTRNIANIFNGWFADGAQPFPTVMKLEDYEGEALGDLRAGRTVRVGNVGLLVEEPGYAAIAELGVQALLSVPLMIDDRLKVNISIHQHEPREWTDGDVALVQEVAERLWAEVVRARAEKALRDSEERLQKALSIGTVGVLFWGPDFRLAEVNDAFLRFTGFAREEAIGKSWQELTPPEFHALSKRAVDEVQETGRGTPYEKQYYRKDGSRWWGLFAPQRLSESEAVEFVIDVSDRRQAEAALRDSAERLRLIVENARDYAIFTTDAEGRIDQWYEGAAEVFGWSAEEAIGQMAEITFTPEDRAESEPAKEREVAAQEGRAPNVRWHMRKDGKRIFIEGIASPLRDGSGALTGFLKIGQDVTERQRAEEHQKTLLAELQHRVRNIMAMIRSVARRTQESAETVEDYAQHLEGRISAMARTQALLTRGVHAEVDLEGLVRDELEMQAAQPGQYIVTGPDVSLPAKAAEVLGLALHELATNSVKYGVLSGNDGRVDVRWALLDGEKAPQLSLIWSERGVRIDNEPSRRGFGTELVTERVPYELEGAGTMEFTPDGLIATIEFPLAERLSILQTDEGLSGSA